MRFEWDEATRRRNFVKHGVDFPDVLPAFNGRSVLEQADARQDCGEPRWIRLAEVEGVVLHIIYTRRGKVIRLNSAGRASRRERKAYYR